MLFYFHLLMMSLIKKYLSRKLFFKRQLGSYMEIWKCSEFRKGMKRPILFINTSTEVMTGPWGNL